MEDVLLGSLSETTRSHIETQLAGKGGSELKPRSDGRTKFFAAHSSAALAANCFGPFLGANASVPIAGQTYTGATELEKQCATGLGGTPPTLDFVVEGDQTVLGVESKCTEVLSEREATFSDRYESVIDTAHKSWSKEYKRLRDNPHRYRHLDAAQLVKHYLGLRTAYPKRRITLLYLYWRPTNADAFAPYAIHEAEVEEFARRVADPRLRFLAMTYDELWDQWSKIRQPTWLKAHVKQLRRRYSVAA